MRKHLVVLASMALLVSAGVASAQECNRWRNDSFACHRRRRGAARGANRSKHRDERDRRASSAGAAATCPTGNLRLTENGHPMGNLRPTADHGAHRDVRRRGDRTGMQPVAQ